MTTILLSMSPEILVSLTAFLVMALDLRRQPDTRMQSNIAVLGLVCGAFACTPDWLDGLSVHLWGGVFISDPLSALFRALACAVGALVVLLSIEPVEGDNEHPGEFVTLVPFVVLGLMLAVSAGELLTFFLAFELLSLPLYILAAWGKYRSRSAEAGLKYFLTGAVSSAVMLYGISLIYGSTGTTYLEDLAPAFNDIATAPHAFVLGAVMLLGALCFKIAAAPFHMWAPDVYEGAPRPSAAFLSTAPKAAMIAVLLRFFWGNLALKSTDFILPDVWVVLFAAMAILSMFWGNLVALAQTDIKRLLAYSGIAHIGYTLLGLVAANPDTAGADGAAAAIYYTIVYSFGNLAAWGVVMYWGWKTGSDRIADYSGLARRSPFLALVLMLSFMSLAGVPPLAGFVGKFWLFRAVWEADRAYWWLVLIGIVNSVISLYYYFGVLKPVYFGKPKVDEPLEVSGRYRVALVACLVVIVGLALCPAFTRASMDAATAVFVLPAR